MHFFFELLAIATWKFAMLVIKCMVDRSEDDTPLSRKIYQAVKNLVFTPISTSVHDYARESRTQSLLYELSSRPSRSNEKNSKGLSLLHIVVSKGNCYAASRLIDLHADIAGSDDLGFAAIHFASSIGSSELISLLACRGASLQQPNSDGFTALHIAVMKGHFDMIDLLIKLGADVNARNNDGSTALHIACLKNSMKMVMRLIAHGANIKYQDNNYMSVFHLSCSKGHREAAHLMIQLQMDVNGVDYEGKTPVQLACCSNKIDIVKLLLKYKIDVNYKHNLDGTPLHICCKRNKIEIAKLLLRYGANIYTQDLSGQPALYFVSDPNTRAELMQTHRMYLNWCRRKNFMKMLSGSNLLHSFTSSASITSTSAARSKATQKSSKQKLADRRSEGATVIYANCGPYFSSKPYAQFEVLAEAALTVLYFEKAQREAAAGGGSSRRRDPPNFTALDLSNSQTLVVNILGNEAFYRRIMSFL